MEDEVNNEDAQALENKDKKKKKKKKQVEDESKEASKVEVKDHEKRMQARPQKPVKNVTLTSMKMALVPLKNQRLNHLKAMLPHLH